MFLFSVRSLSLSFGLSLWKIRKDEDANVDSMVNPLHPSINLHRPCVLPLFASPNLGYAHDSIQQHILPPTFAAANIAVNGESKVDHHAGAIGV